MKKLKGDVKNKPALISEIPMQIVQYMNPNTKLGLDVYSDNDALWLTQKAMAELFGVEVQTINYHLKEIFATGELTESSVIRKIRITANDGKNYLTGMYHLDAIIAVGYRVNSFLATKFRIWATSVLREYIVKGFTLDDERLKGNNALIDYFDELLARIRDIRASEKRAYLRVREIFALAVDYDPKSPATQTFFAKMQNKMHYAATGNTAAEIIAERVDASKANMGLTSWKGNVVRKGDVSIAKNYLNEREIDILNRIVVMWLDAAELRLLRHQQLYTHEWETVLNKFIVDNDLPLQKGKARVSPEKAKELADTAYQQFEQRRRKNKEKEAEANYLQDLQSSAKLMAVQRKKNETTSEV